MSMPIRPPLNEREEMLRALICDDSCDHLGIRDCEYRARRVARDEAAVTERLDDVEGSPHP